MHQRSWMILLVVVLLAVTLAGCSTKELSAPAARTSPDDRPGGASVTAEAFVLPVRQVDLALPRGGRAARVAVKEGDTVSAGELLVQLDDSEMRAAEAQAEATLGRSQAQLASLKAAPTSEQVARLAAAVAQAEAEAALVKAGPTKQAIAAAQARVNTLQAQLANAKAGARKEAIDASATTVLAAEAAVRKAQADYDRVKDHPEVTVREGAALPLQDATLRLEAAKANHEALLNGPTAAELAVLQAQVAEGQAALAQVKAGPRSEQVAQAEAAVRQTKEALMILKAGPTSEQIAVGEAGVREAEAALKQVRTAFSDLELKAPFAGVVAAINLEESQYIAPGVPVVVIADLSAWKLETDDLVETDIVRVREGQAVHITVDALPEKRLEGRVSRIKPRSVAKAGDVTYTVVITPTEPDFQLRWGMTASVEFEGYAVSDSDEHCIPMLNWKAHSLRGDRPRHATYAARSSGGFSSTSLCVTLTAMPGTGGHFV